MDDFVWVDFVLLGCCCFHLQPVWQQLQTLLVKNPGNGGWRRQLVQQQATASRLQQRTARLQQQAADLEAYTGHALAIMAKCSPACASQVQALSELASTALCSDTTTALDDEADAAESEDCDYSGDEDSSDAAADGVTTAAGYEDPHQRQAVQYQELHQQVLASCGGSSDTRQALEAMAAIALRAIQQQPLSA